MVPVDVINDFPIQRNEVHAVHFFIALQHAFEKDVQTIVSLQIAVIDSVFGRHQYAQHIFRVCVDDQRLTLQTADVFIYIFGNLLDNAMLVNDEIMFRTGRRELKSNDAEYYDRHRSDRHQDDKELVFDALSDFHLKTPRYVGLQTE